MKVRYTTVAWDRLRALSPEQQAQAKRLIRAILFAQTNVGRPWNRDLRSRLHWIVSALDTHVIYRIAFRQVEDVLYVTNVLIFPTPPDPNNE
ncbi:MAG: hypothetical protein MUD01_14335 [Chloroflexaceae bacterium]|jgi:hypothetical protein|nr:hypothetical protein [Chloroflexaceae bacterium]